MATSIQTEDLTAARPNFATPSDRVVPAKVRPKKKLLRRTDRDYSQVTRRTFQFVFLVWNVYLGGLFYLWVRHFETGATTQAPVRPPGIEGWLPIAGMMNFKYWVLTGHVASVHPAAMFLLITFVAISFLFRKAFCSWLCPIGTISEMLARLGHKLFRRNFKLHRWIDIPLRGLKYLLLGFFVWAVSSMSASAIALFMRSPYGVIADVKMLNFFRHIGEVGLIVLGILVVASMFVQNFWCRYLCPYGALLGITSIFSPARIRRNPETCIDCAKCAKACPSSLPVDKLITIKSAECTGCLECVAVCPAQDALALVLPLQMAERPQKLPVWAVAAGISVLFVGIVGYAKTAGFWNTNIPHHVYVELVPHADQASHPMPGDPALNE
jgi:polyferredoxin